MGSFDNLAKDWKILAIGICGAIMPSTINAHTVDRIDDGKDKEFKFTAPTYDFSNEIVQDAVPQEELKAKTPVMMPKGVLTNPHVSDYNMESGHMIFYHSNKGIHAVRFVAPNGASCAINADMDKDLISRLDVASDKNNEVELLKLSKEMAKVQDKFGLSDAQVIAASTEGFGLDESLNKTGISYQKQVDMSLADTNSKSKSNTFTQWAVQANKSLRR